MKRLGLVAGFVCVLTACGQSGTTISKASPSRPIATSALQTVPASLATSAASSSINCRLPVLVPRSGGSEPLGGWVTLPGGDYTRDPSSPTDVVNHVPSYDWPLQRWLPVESVNRSPDGSLYALDQLPGVAPGSIDLVNVTTGTRHVIFSSPQYRRVVAYTSGGIYLTDTGINPDAGLWLLNPETGAVRLIPGSEHDPGWTLVGARAAWTVSGFTNQTVLRLDLDTGQVSNWYHSSLPMVLAAIDGRGLPIIKVLGDAVRMGLLAGPKQFQEFQLPAGVDFWGEAFAESSRVWLPLQRDGGLALFTGDPTVKVLKTRTGLYSFTIAGDCA
jgi:hypothetical protein